MVTMDKLQELHDRMIAEMPESASHSKDTCMYCTGEYASLVEGGPVATYTDEELDAKVAEATAALQAELEEAKKAMPPKKGDDDADDKESAAVQALIETQSKVEELTAKLDTAVIEAEKAKTERDEVTNWLQSEHDKVLAEAERATKRADRIAQVAMVVTFPEAYVAERAESWVDLEEAQFEALLADYKAMGAKPKAGSEPLPRFTAMQAAREESAESTVVGSDLKDLIRGRNYGVDVRATR